MKKLKRWGRRADDEDGLPVFEGETEDGATCSVKLRNMGGKARQIVEKVGDAECIRALKKRLSRPAGED